MKLYATTTSERESKEQGGNEFIDTIYTAGENKNPHTIGMVTLSLLGNEWMLKWGAHESEDWTVSASGTLKGKKQWCECDGVTTLKNDGKRCLECGFELHDSQEIERIKCISCGKLITVFINTAQSDKKKCDSCIELKGKKQNGECDHAYWTMENKDQKCLDCGHIG